MPLLKDATSCFVGQTQIQKIYAGSQLVWGGEKLTDFQFYYGTTEPLFDKSPTNGGSACLYASWVTDQRPAQCSDTLGQSGIQHTFDRIDKPGNWTLKKWDDEYWKAIPTTSPGLMVMEAHANMYPYDTRFRLAKNTNTLPEYSDEFRVGTASSTDPDYTLYTDLPRLPFEWLADSACYPPVVVTQPGTVVWQGTKFNVVYFRAVLHQSEWNSCINMQESFEYRIRYPDNTYTDWLPFRGWVAPVTFGSGDRECQVWVQCIATSDFPSQTSRMTLYLRETNGERSFTGSYLYPRDSEMSLVNVGITLNCV